MSVISVFRVTFLVVPRRENRDHGEVEQPFNMSFHHGCINGRLASSAKMKKFREPQSLVAGVGSRKCSNLRAVGPVVLGKKLESTGNRQQ